MAADSKVPTPVRFEAELLAELRRLAGKHDRSLAGEVRAACRHWVSCNSGDPSPGFSVRAAHGADAARGVTS